MKLLALLLPIYLFSVTIDHSYVKSEFNHLTPKQKATIQSAYQVGNLLIVNGEQYGYTLATIALVETSARSNIIGDDGTSFGLTQVQILTARRLLSKSTFYRGLRAVSDEHLAYLLTTNNHFNLVMAGLYFKENLLRYKSYSKAVRRHNGYAPKRGIYNTKYYTKFVNAMQIVKLVIAESNH